MDFGLKMAQGFRMWGCVNLDSGVIWAPASEHGFVDSIFKQACSLVSGVGSFYFGI